MSVLRLPRATVLAAVLATVLTVATSALAAPTPAYAEAPAIVITSPTPGEITPASLTAQFAVSGADEHRCILDGSEVPCGASSATLENLTDDQHTFGVLALVDGVPVASEQVTWWVDAGAPQATLLDRPDPETSAHDARFTWYALNAPDLARFECLLDGTPLEPCTSPLVADGLADGTHEFQVRGHDVHGNVGSWAVHAWAVDPDFPDVHLTQAPPALTSASAAQIAFELYAPDGVAGSATCSFGDTTISPCTSPVTVPPPGSEPLADGPHELRVDFTDDGGRPVHRIHAWTVDTTAPSLDVQGPGGYSGSAASFTITGTDAHGPVTFACELDSVPVACGPEATFSGLADGPHTLGVVATDAAGNASTSVDHAWVVDSTKPTVTLTSPTSPVTLTATVKVGWTGSDLNGIDLYELLQRTAGPSTGFTAPTLVHAAGTAGSTTRSLTPGTTYCFTAIAWDPPANQGTSLPRCTSSPLDDRGLTRSAGWTRGTGSAYYRGTWTLGTRQGARLSRTGVTAKRLGLVATRCASCGTVGVYVGATKVGTVRLAAATTRHRQVVLLPAFASARTGTVSLRILSSGKPVRIDGLVVVR